MKIKTITFLLFFITPWVLKAQGYIPSFNVGFGYIHFEKDNKVEGVNLKYPFKSSFSFGNRIELILPSKNFNLEMGFSFQRFQYERIAERPSSSTFFINGQLLDGILKSARKRRYHFLGVPISLNLCLLRSKFKVGVHPIFLIELKESEDYYFRDTQGNIFVPNLLFNTTYRDGHTIFLETFLEYTHQVYKNTWLKIAWYKTQQFFNYNDNGFLPTFKFELGFVQYVN